MDNITHSFVGVALSDLALRAAATKTERRLFLAGSLVASNAPDVDLVYTGITPQPLGYLLHHRGHTHTIPGLLVLGLLITLVCWLSPTARRLIAADRVRLSMVIWANLVGHVLLDALNTYGVHPFYPFDARWYYGDAVFIFEPWLWLLLGVAAAWNVWSRLARLAIVAIITLLPVTLASYGFVPGRALATLVVAGGVLAWAARHMSPRARAVSALAASSLVCVSMFGLSRVAGTVARTALEPAPRGEIVDIVLNPNPASPLCWAVIVVEKDERAGEFVLRRGTLSFLPAWQPPTGCASHRFGKPGTTDVSSAQRVVWSDEIREPLQRLRDLSYRDCQAKAWLQFGRAPVIRDGTLLDLRFDTGMRENFTAMTLRPEHEAAGCPPNVTSWAMPRADLLTPLH